MKKEGEKTKQIWLILCVWAVRRVGVECGSWSWWLDEVRANDKQRRPRLKARPKGYSRKYARTHRDITYVHTPYKSYWGFYAQGNKQRTFWMGSQFLPGWQATQRENRKANHNNKNHTHTHSHTHTCKKCVWENLCICHKIIYQLEKFLDRLKGKGKGKVHEARKNAQALYKLMCACRVCACVSVCVYLRVKLWQEEIKKHKFITGQTMTTKTWPQARRECGTARRGAAIEHHK